MQLCHHSSGCQKSQTPFPPTAREEPRDDNAWRAVSQIEFSDSPYFPRGKYFIFSFLGNRLIIEPNQSEAGAKSQEADVCPHQLMWENPVQTGGPMSCDRKGGRGIEADPAAQASASRDLIT